MMSFAKRSRILPMVALASPFVALADEDCDDHVALVRLAPGVSVAAFNTQFETSTLSSIASQNIHLLAVAEGTNYGDLESAASGSPLLVTIEQNCEVVDTSPEGGTRTFFFNTFPDAFQNQAAVSIIGLPAAQTLSRGTGVTVAIIDTGVSPHPVIAANIVTGGFDFVGNDANTIETGDGIDNDGDGFTDEMVGHGTLIAGLVVRAAPRASILPIRVMDDEGISSTFLLTAGIYHAVSAGADVLNISMGTTAESTLIGDAIGNAAAAGVLVVASVGNEGNESPVRYPAGYTAHGVVGVASTANNDVRSDFSNYGTHVAICAPGEAIAGPDTATDYHAASGTSFSAPLVAGTLALLRQADPAASAMTLREALLTTATPIDALNPSYVGRLGSGRLNSAAAVRSPLLCRGDLNMDRSITLLDLAALLANFGVASGATHAQGDITGDAAVLLEDLTALLSAFGRVCD